MTPSSSARSSCSPSPRSSPRGGWPSPRICRAVRSSSSPRSHRSRTGWWPRRPASRSSSSCRPRACPRSRWPSSSVPSAVTRSCSWRCAAERRCGGTCGRVMRSHCSGARCRSAAISWSARSTSTSTWSCWRYSRQRRTSGGTRPRTACSTRPRSSRPSSSCECCIRCCLGSRSVRARSCDSSSRKHSRSWRSWAVRRFSSSCSAPTRSSRSSTPRTRMRRQRRRYGCSRRVFSSSTSIRSSATRSLRPGTRSASS